MIDIYFWTTDNGYKALIMIEESGLPHRRKPVALPKRENFAPEFLKISPGHKIPAMVDDDGPGGARVTLCESGAILKYLAEKSGGALYPADPLKRVTVDQWFFYGTSTFTPLAQQYGLFMHRFPEDVPQAKKHYEAQVRDIFGVFDRHLADSAFMAGDYSVADISSYPDVHLHGKLGIGLNEYPNLNRWHDAVAARPAVQRAYAPI
ncbi:MAG TPA: glutathione S-transferase family protein [Stellaceae bacterium]|nr:glutathione S-transferase family protein [Stellaceae bacterium]